MKYTYTHEQEQTIIALVFLVVTLVYYIPLTLILLLL
jgi:hypothetical protein